jgi:V/A-type H+/Na+-transporting ATPase subunit E
VKPGPENSARTPSDAAPPPGGATDPVRALEDAVMAQAHEAVEARRRTAGEAARRITLESQERLRQREERELSAARARADRERQRLVQSRASALKGDLERDCFERYAQVMRTVRERLAALADNEREYLPILEGLLREGAACLGSEALKVTLNRRDREHLTARWESIARRVAPGQGITLAPDYHSDRGGAILTSADGRLRMDNTFEGRIERLGNALYRAVLGELFPGGIETTGSGNAGNP